MQIPIAYASRTELVAIGSHVVIRIVDGHRTQIEDFDRLDAAISVAMAGVPAFGVLQISWQGTPAPPLAVQRHAAQLMDSYADRACVVVALLGLGFWSATFATAITSLASTLQMSRIHVETSVEAAAELLARELLGLNPQALVQAYQALYQHMRTLEPS